MKNVRVKVGNSRGGDYWDYGIYVGRKRLMSSCVSQWWHTEKAAIRNAKAMAKRIGIKYDSEIIKQYGY